MSMYGEPEYIGTPRLAYSHGSGDSMVFLRACPECGRFVKADETVLANDDGPSKKPNATCKVHGRVTMPFEGWGGDGLWEVEA